MNKFIELTEFLKSNNNCLWVLQKERATNEIIELLKLKDIPFFITNTLAELINEINNCSLLISNDSGPIHIANVLGKPTFTIFGPTNPLYILPSGKRHKFIQKKIICTPGGDQNYCFTNAGRNGCLSFECMNQLNVDEVINSVKLFLAELQIQTKQNLQIKS